jgi:dTDP-4-dehydrorhamnose reductase
VRILLLGAAGQLGTELRRALAHPGLLLPATRTGTLVDGTACAAADLADPASLAAALDAAMPDVVVNAAAHTAVDRAEDEPALADRINHRAVGEIGRWAAAHGARVLHYSTDYVFDGSARRPYREDDPVAPLGAYGRSKLAGEEALRASGATHLIVRTAWVYAVHGHNFLHTMLRLARDRDELRVVDDQVGAPTPAHWTAQASAAILATWRKDPAGAGPGMVHLAASGQCSWHRFAEAIVDGALARGLLSRRPAVTAVSSSEFPTRARRPAWSVLDTSRLRACFGLQLPDWREGLDAVLDALARDAPPLPGEGPGGATRRRPE